MNNLTKFTRMPVSSFDLHPAGYASPADLAECRAMLRTGSRTFLAASHLLRRRVRDPAISLYAFCRMADDAIDGADDPGPALTWLQERLVRIYAGNPLPIAADRALADVIARFDIPRELPGALLEGFAWDAVSRRYEDLPALTAYAVRVAGTVGMMMSLLMGARAPSVLARACDLGVAMQLSNIARDVGEDARAGRLYLPLGWLRDAGIDPDVWLAAPAPCDGISAVVQRLLRVADGLYDRSAAGISRLPLSCRPGMVAARMLYAEIGREVERRGNDFVMSRAVVSDRQKLLVLARALAGAGRSGKDDLLAPPLPEADFLISAVSSAFRQTAVPCAGDKMLWVLGLFERLERQQARQPGI
jgi:phytoene synthase